MSNESKARNEGSLRRLIRPALWLVLAMGQFGPFLEPEGWPRVIDCLLRAVVAFPFTLFALCDLVNILRPTAQYAARRRSDD